MPSVLYISYDGMTDPLGQSQVIPYLQGLAAHGYSITILSAEKKQAYQNHASHIQAILDDAGIAWKTVFYTKKPPVLSTISDVFALRRAVRQLMKTTQFHLVHCRSYITPMAGLLVKRKQAAGLLFDMRGFWADERVDGGLWNLKNPVFNAVYRFFKQKEKHYLEMADATVALTHAAKAEMYRWVKVRFNPESINVIPCCADFALFQIPDNRQRQLSRSALGYTPENLVFAYLGSLGTWYLIDEMMQFFAAVQQAYPQAKLLIITRDTPGVQAENAGISPENIQYMAASRSEVPQLLSAVDIGISFIKPSYSKKSSSPTKQGEMLAMGIPMIVNSGVGDVDEIVLQTQSGAILYKMKPEAFNAVINKIPALLQLDRNEIRHAAAQILDLKTGIESYHKIYKQLCREA